MLISEVKLININRTKLGIVQQVLKLKDSHEFAELT